MTGRHRSAAGTAAVAASASSTLVADESVDDVTFGGLFRTRDFAVLYVAGTQSQLGDQLARVALSILVFARTGSGLATAATYALTFLPAFVGGLALSGLADSRPRRALMVTCDLVRAGLFALMSIPGLPLPLLCVLLVVAVLAGSPYSAAEPAVVADLFSGARYQAAVGLRTATSQAMQLVGFAVGGVIVALTGAEVALLIDAISFAGAGVLISIGLSHFPASVPGARTWRQLRGGARTIAGDARLRVLLGFAWLTAFWVLPEGLAAPFANDHGGGPVAVGLLLAANPTGSLIGTVVLTRWVRPASRSRLTRRAGHRRRIATVCLCRQSADLGGRAAVGVVWRLQLLRRRRDRAIRHDRADAGAWSGHRAGEQQPARCPRHRVADRRGGDRMVGARGRHRLCRCRRIVSCRVLDAHSPGPTGWAP